MKKENSVLNESSTPAQIWAGFDQLFTRKGIKTYIPVKNEAYLEMLIDQGVPIFHKNGDDHENIDTVLKPVKSNESSRSFTLTLAMLANSGKTLTPEGWAEILAKQSTSEPSNEQQNRFIGSHVKNVFSALKQELTKNEKLNLSDEQKTVLIQLLTPPIIK